VPTRRERSYSLNMTCLFCGSDGKMSREHVTPKWIAKLFPGLADVEYHRVFREAQGAPKTHRRSGLPFDQTVNRFCVDCNTGWMAALEETVAPILTPLIEDHPRSLDAVEQERIAVWATKTVLAFGPTNQGKVEIASPEIYRWFGDHKTPLPGSLVWLAYFAGAEAWPALFQHHGMVIAREDEPMPPPGSATNGFHSALTMGPLAIFVFWADMPDGAVARGGSDDQRVLVWPTYGPSVRWPPPKSIASVAELQEQTRKAPTGPVEPFPVTHWPEGGH
jgi:hypothetical protein